MTRRDFWRLAFALSIAPAGIGVVFAFTLDLVSSL